MTDPTFWRDLAARAARQVAQVLIPVLTLAVSSGTIRGLDYTALAVTAGMAVLVTVLRGLTGVRAPDGAPFWLDGLDRALAAAAGTGLALVTAEGFDLLHADLAGILGAVAASAALALLTRFTNAPQPPQPAPVAEPAGNAPVIYDYSGEVDTTGDGAA